jgi:hypothetical protein
MKKKANKSKIILRNCEDCRYSFMNKNELYCELRLQNINILKSGGIVSHQECNWFSASRKD